MWSYPEAVESSTLPFSVRYVLTLCSHFLKGKGHLRKGHSILQEIRIITVIFIEVYVYSFTKGENRVCSGGAVGRGSDLQAGRSQVQFPIVSLEFFINIIVGLGSTQHLT
jgi:hypothetical protein